MGIFHAFSGGDFGFGLGKIVPVIRILFYLADNGLGKHQSQHHGFSWVVARISCD